MTVPESSGPRWASESVACAKATGEIEQLVARMPNMPHMNGNYISLIAVIRARRPQHSSTSQVRGRGRNQPVVFVLRRSRLDHAIGNKRGEPYCDGLHARHWF